MIETRRKRILFLTLRNDIGSDRLVAAMARLGATCEIIGPRGSFAARSKYADRLFRIPTRAPAWVVSVFVRSAIERAMRVRPVDLVIPLDEPAARLLRHPQFYARSSDALRGLIETSFGKRALERTGSDTLGETARRLGLRGTRERPAAEGQAAFRTIACAEGRVLDGISFGAASADPTGPATVLQPLDRPDMEIATRSLVSALGCSGFVTVDFTLDREGAHVVGGAFCPAASAHLGRLYGHDIHEAMLDHLGGTNVVAAEALTGGPEMIALFPHELDRDPRSPAVNTPSVLHDVPWDDWDIVETYARWLEKRHPKAVRFLQRSLPLDGPPTTLDLRRLVASLDRYSSL